MKEYAPREKKPSQVDAVAKAPTLDSRAPRVFSGDLSAPALNEPANSERLAEVLGAFQRSAGNLAVQRMLGREETQLPPAVRETLESALGEDLGAVRLRTGGTAAAEAGALDARAFARPDEISFGEGEFDPESAEGREMIAHEAAHVVQYRRSGVSSNEAAAEHEASRAASALSRGQPVPVRETAGPQALLRQKKEGTPPKKEPEKPKEPPKVPPKPENVALAFRLTAAITAAIEEIIHDSSFEDKLIEIFAAPAQKQTELLLAAVLMFPAAAQEVTKQQPPGVEKATFMREFARFLWEETGGELVKEAEHRYQTDQAFRKKVDRAKGKRETAAAEAKPLAKT